MTGVTAAKFSSTTRGEHGHCTLYQELTLFICLGQQFDPLNQSAAVKAVGASTEKAEIR